MSEYLGNEKLITLIKAPDYFQKSHAEKTAVDTISGILKITITPPLTIELIILHRLISVPAKKNFYLNLKY